MILQYIKYGDRVPPGYRRVSDKEEILQIYGEVLGWSDIVLADHDFYQNTGVPPQHLENHPGLCMALTNRRPSTHCVLPHLIVALPEVECVLEKLKKEEEK